MRIADFRAEVMLREGRLDTRNQVVTIGLVVRMLKLAPAALGKVPARWLLVMRSRRQGSVVEQRVAGDSKRHVAPACGHAVSACRDPDDQLVHSTAASAWGIAWTRSSAIMAGPAISAARP